ncbi:MAG: hypothetical protein RLZZ63_303 [Gemmatimonadota bacterium]|jgi:rhamnosyltransferase
MSARLVSVIVTYAPDAEALTRQVSVLATLGSVVVVDNTASTTPFPDCAPAHLLRNDRNVGIATALNQGLAEARRVGADIIALFDQDTEIDADLVRRLISPLEPGCPGVVGAVALAATDGREYPSHRLHPIVGWRAVFAARAVAPLAADVVISSGSAATLATYDRVGGYDDGLFIDGVDVDWCLRCRARGVPVRIMPSVRLRHRIGSHEIRVLGLGRTIAHGEWRTYFKLRNPWLLARRPHCPPMLALRLVTMSLLREFLVALRRPSFQRTRAMVAGLRDGMLGRSGPWRPT